MRGRSVNPAKPAVLIIADIEGSSGCFTYEDSQFLAATWPRACRAMSLDVAAVVRALFEAGAPAVTVKDFHRTAYNLLPELIDPRARVVLGYRQGPVPGIGDPGDATCLMMMGMHAPSGSGGFLAHTLTSRIAALRVNGRLTGEAELFASSLGPRGLRPVFFSGCPVACQYAAGVLPHLAVYPIDKRDPGFDAAAWRAGLADAAARALDAPEAGPYVPRGAVSAVVTLRDGADAAAVLARRWGLRRDGADLLIDTPGLNELYQVLIRACYVTPLVERLLPLGLRLYNAYGRAGQAWVRHRLNHAAG